MTSEAAVAPSVSVVIPTYNRAGSIEAVLRPLLADPAAEEIIVVVDGSEDGTLELLERLADEEPRIVPLWQANAGEGAARQAGLERASRDVVLFIDDDVIPTPGLVAGHALAHAEAANRVVVGYMPTADPDPEDDHAFTVDLYSESYEARCRFYEEDPGTVLKTLWAGNISMRRATAIAVGLTNPAYRERYHPDRELGLRLLGAGASGEFRRDLRATHQYRRTLDAFVNDSRSQGAGETVLHRMYPDHLGRLEPDRFEQETPAWIAVLIRATRRPRARQAAVGVLRATIAAAGRRRDRPVQVRAARLLRRIEQQRGAIDLLAGRR